MAKRAQRRHKTNGRSDADVVRGPSRTRVEGNINPFAIPAPKGKNPGPIPRSTRWTPPEADPEEAAAFSGRVGEMAPPDARNSRVSAAALDAARRRMSGVRIEDEDDEPEEIDDEPIDEGDDGNGDHEDDERAEQVQESDPQPQAAPAPFLANRAPHNAGTPAKALHPATQYEPPQVAAMPAPKSGVKFVGDGVITHPSGLYVTKVTLKCIDALWDWIRADGDYGKAFLGMPITTSMALYQYVQYIAKGEEHAQSTIKSIFWYGNGSHPDHLGFVMLSPILANEKTALMHVYLRQDARGNLGKMIGPLVDMAEAYAPGMHLAVYSADDVWARLHKRLLEPLGFKPQVMFIK